MKPYSNYVMHDQVRNLVPSLNQVSNPDAPKGIRAWLQLAGFGLAVASYIVAIALTA